MESILELFGYTNTFTWLLAAIAAYKFSGIYDVQNKGWIMVMIGSILMLVRQAVQHLPNYDTNYLMQVVRFGIGIASGIILAYGFYTLFKLLKKIQSL